VLCLHDDDLDPVPVERGESFFRFVVLDDFETKDSAVVRRRLGDVG